MNTLVNLFLLCLGLLGSCQGQAIKYQFKPRNTPGSCMVSANGGFSVATCDGTNANQKFAEQLSSAVMTTIVTGQTVGCNQLALDAVPGTAPSGAQTNFVKQVAWNPGSKTQYWIQQLPTGGTGLQTGFVWFKNWGTGACLTTESGYVDTYPCTANAQNQWWSIGEPNAATSSGSTLANPSALVVLGIPVGAGNCLKVTGGNPNPDTATITAACTPNEFSENFYVFNRTASFFGIGTTGNCLDGGSAGQNSYPYPCTPSAPNHQWMRFNYPSDTDGSYVHFMNLNSGQCLTWDPASPPVKVAPCVAGNINQEWQTLYVA